MCLCSCVWLHTPHCFYRVALTLLCCCCWRPRTVTSLAKQTRWLVENIVRFSFSKAKCAKDPENEIIKQKTSARADKQTNVVVSTADSLRLTSCHVVSFRFVCSRSLSRSLADSFTHNLLSLLAVCLCSLRRLRSVNLVALARPGPVRPSPRNPKLLSIISFGYSRTLIRTNAVKKEITEMLRPMHVESGASYEHEDQLK